MYEVDWKLSREGSAYVRMAGHYVIRGGVEGRERLRILARVMRPSTVALLERVGVSPGMSCLDVGCGGGDVTLELARLVGRRGRVVGIDIDEQKLELACAEAGEQGVENVEFRTANADGSLAEGCYDLAYARFLLTHLSDPAGCIERMRTAVKPGGLVAVEDIDFTGSFSYPDSPAYRRYADLYTEAVRRRGGDANIGPRLPRLLLDAGLEDVDMNVVQPAGLRGEAKLITPITMENIAGAVAGEGLATPQEIERLVVELYELARDVRVVVSVPRVVQAWGRTGRE